MVSEAWSSHWLTGQKTAVCRFYSCTRRCVSGSAYLNLRLCIAASLHTCSLIQRPNGSRCFPQPQVSIAVKPANLKQVEPACIICLEGGCDERNGELIALGCGCRGSSGFVHEQCAIQAAAAQQERAGTWSGPIGKHPWQLCPTCKLPYTGALKLALAQEWCRRTEALAPEDTQRFAARTALGNALSAAGRLAEAEALVRANLGVVSRLHVHAAGRIARTRTRSTCTSERARRRASHAHAHARWGICICARAQVSRLHGAEHRMTLGTTLNLGMLLDGLGRHAEASEVYSSVLETQRRVLGHEHKDTLSTAMQLAGASLQAGANAEAEAQYRLVLEAQMRVLGPTHPSTLTCQMNLASALLNQAR